MSRKATPDIDEELGAPVDGSASDGTDHHGFWDGPTLDLEELDAAFAGDDGIEPAPERETLVYMGSVPQTQIDDQELMALADWAESKACATCRAASKAHRDGPPLEHDGCRTALRVGTLLRRYS